ncbi:MAG: phage terminase large subunit, partial [Patescibacteria group bacterium]|nr:phage terminase large subunit [Patescibacteria group bacterium]
RKTYNSIQDSVGKTYKRLLKGLNVRELGGTRTDKLIFPNGSEIVFIGLDKPDKLLSSEWSTIQVCQTEELSEAEWEMAASRATGRGFKYKFPAIFGDANPGASQHWLRKRKSLRMIVGSQKDNPELYDDAGNLTPEGKRRMDLADKMLTGVRRQRLLYGNWATAEGAVYDMFSTQVHVKERPMSEIRQVFLSVDEGYTNPAVILAIGEDSDGRMHVFREFYKTGQLQETVVREIKSWSDEFGGVQIYVDEAAAGLIADIRALGLNVQGAKGRTPDSSGKHIIMEGIEAVRNRLKVQDDGRPRFTVDPSCVNTINELESYHFLKDGSEMPEKTLDHACDCIRYFCAARMNKTGFDSADGFRVGGNAGIVDLSDNLIFVPERLELDQF